MVAVQMQGAGGEGHSGLLGQEKRAGAAFGFTERENGGEP